jgi:membrane-bound lytic murein transglycosylase D
VDLRKIGVLIISLAILAGCSSTDTDRLLQSDRQTAKNVYESDTTDNSLASDPQTNTINDTEIIRNELNEAEDNYTRGVLLYQQNILDSSQVAFERALSIMADLDIDSDANPEEAKWMETLLKEIEVDYRLTLMASGSFLSEGSAAAFREMFSDVKNFKNLQQSSMVKQIPPESTGVTYDVPITYNEHVENSLIYLQTVAHDVFERYLGRSSRYIPLMEKILAEEGIPHDIVYLPLIESGFNTSAYSYAKAMGPWQFISGTGKRYNLSRNWWYDERRDFEKSTRAACKYLGELYAEFQSWELALASYNGGEGRIRKQIAKHGTKDFWSLDFTRQTRDYVPLFMAAVMIAKQPQKYGFNPTYLPPLEWETIEIDKCMSLKKIAAGTGISLDDLELLNPEIMRDVTPPKAQSYSLRLPVGGKEKFLAAYENIPTEKITNWASHTVKRGETPSSIASKYGVSLSAMMAANNLDRKRKIFPGQNLMIPKPGMVSEDVTSRNPDPVPAKATSTPSKANTNVNLTTTYRVRRGDNLDKIAQMHGITIYELKKANDLRSNRILPGKKLTIPLKGTGSGEPAKVYASDRTYRVKNGDSLNKIANNHGVTIASLKALNQLDSEVIRPRMMLKIPAGEQKTAMTKTTDGMKTYRVKRGDTLWQIANAFEVTVEDIMNWNAIKKPTSIKSGDRIKIYAR